MAQGGIQGATHSGPFLEVVDTSTATDRGVQVSQYSTGTDAAQLDFHKARGTKASPVVIVTGDKLGEIVANGYDGTNFLQMGSISFESEGTIASTSVPTRIVFSTGTDVAPSVLTERMRITSGGRIVCGTGTYSLTTSNINFITTSSSQAGFGTVVNNKAVYLYNDGVAYKLDAYDYNTNSALPIMIGTNGGNVLIGTTTSSAKLYAYDNSTTAQPLAYLYQDNASNTYPVLKVQGDGTGDLLQCVDGSTTVFTVADGGAVGIGRTPSYALDVVGNIRSSTGTFLPGAGQTVTGIGDRALTTFGLNTVGNVLVINDIDGAKYAVSTGGYSLTFSKHKSGNATWYPSLVIRGNTVDGYPTGYLFTTGTTEKMRLEDNGNLLIGTTTSSAKLYLYDNSTTAQPLGYLYQDNASNTYPVLKVQGDGTGDLLQCFDGASQVFAVKDGGAVATSGYFACNGATPAAQAAKTADATGTDAAIINAMRTCLINHGFMAAS